MKVVHVTECWVGGIETYIRTLLFDQVLRFESVVLICDSRLTDTRFLPSEVEILFYESSRNVLRIGGVVRGILGMLLAVKPDIVHLHSSYPGLYGRLVKRYPTVYCAHGWSFSQDVNFIKKMGYMMVEWCLAKRSDAIINISRYEQEEASKYGVRSSNNRLIFNGLGDVSQGVGQDLSPEINVGFVGRLDHQKGFDLIEPVFRDFGHNVRLHVIGVSVCKRKIYRSDGGGILYVGWLCADELQDYMSGLDVIIMPSRYEGFGLVGVEAMRSGKPLIVSNRGALPELVIENYNGYVFDLDNVDSELPEILYKLDKYELQRMGRNSRRIFEQVYRADGMLEKTAKLYYEVLGMEGK